AISGVYHQVVLIDDDVVVATGSVEEQSARLADDNVPAAQGQRDRVACCGVARDVGRCGRDDVISGLCQRYGAGPVSRGIDGDRSAKWIGAVEKLDPGARLAAASDDLSGIRY